MSTVDDVLYRNEKGSALTFAELDNNFYKLALAIDNIQLANSATVVVRDSLGNFSANTITANLAGNSATTTKFLTARTINGVSFDGSANITITSNTTQSLANGAYITGSSFNGGTARTWAVDAATAATASKIVARDASGNFAANTITAALVGNASTATTLQTARTISLGGDLSGSATFDGSANITITGTVAVAAVANNAIKLQTARTIFLGGDLSGSATFDGSANVTITATVAADSVALGTDTTGNYVASITNGSYITGGNGGSEGAALTLAVDATNLATASKVVARDASGNFSANTITAALTGNASTATTLQNARNIGDVSFNGSADIVPERITYKDTRGTNFNPYTYAGTTIHIKTNTTDSLADGGTYHGVLNLQHWSDSSGGRNHQLGFTDNGNIHHRSSTSTTTWSAWNRLYDTGDSSSSSTGGTLVLRDANGSFSANVITASSISGTISGNASTATALQTARTINGVSFDGTANITITANTPNSITFNNGGAGGASGSTFNGGTALTVSYNSIGASPLAGSSSLTTTGTITSGTWNGSVIGSTYGGTGVNNGSNTITLGGKISTASSFTTAGAFALTLTQTGITNVTLPTSGTLATTGNLSQFASTTSAQLAGVISDETGSGALVFGTSPTFTTSMDSGATFAAFGSSTALTVGYNSTASSTTNISTGAAASGSTKTINIGTTGASGSVTNINIGSATSGAVGNTVINSASAIIPGNLSVGASILAKTGPVLTLGTLAGGGTGYMNGTHTNVALTGGTGLYVLATVTVALGVVTGITLTWGGHRYSANDTLTVPSLPTTLATTAASGDGTTATLTFAAQAAAPFEVGSQIIVAGVTPTGYNGTFTVTACTTTTVSYLNTTTGAQTVAGTVKMGTPLTNSTIPVATVQGADIYISASPATYGARIRLESNNTTITASQEYGAVVFSSRDATVQASGDVALIKAIALGTSGGSNIQFWTSPAAAASALAATIASTGDFTAVGNVTAYSDRRLKSNIRTIDSALDKVTAMRGVYFDKDGKASVGVIAQEIEEVLPEVVLDGDYKSVAYGNIVGVLIEAIKELRAEIDELKRGS